MNLEPLLNTTFPPYEELCKIADEVFASDRANEELRMDHVQGEENERIEQEIEDLGGEDENL